MIWVSLARLLSALISTSRSAAKFSASASRASSACPQLDTMSTSMARRSASDSGMVSSSCARMPKARCRVVVEWLSARTKLRVRSAPNSAVAMSSSARALRIDSSVDTSSSCESFSSTSIGSAIKLPVSFGLMSRASAVIEAVCLVRLRRE